MKKKNLLFAILTMFSFVNTTKAQVPTYVPSTGLVGWWSFNGSANDDSGNGNNGTVNGATLTTDRLGNLHAAYDFNANAYIVCPQNNIPSQISSLSVWLYQDNTFANMQFVCLGSSASTRWGAVASNNNIYMAYGAGCSGVGGNILNTSTLPTGVWTHLVYVSTGVGGICQIYKNGQYAGQTTNSTSTGGCSTQNLYFGVDIFSVSEYIDGKLDDIGIWDRVLTVCEIQDLYSSQLNSTFVSAGIDQTICNGDQVTLTATGSQNYNWNNGVVDGSPFTPTNTSDYIVTADSAGCQSADTISVTVNQPTNSTLNETALDTYTLNGQTYTQSGTFTQIIPNSEDCDSTITLNLTMNYTGINEVDVDLISVSPNPSTGILNIQVSENLIGTKFHIHDEVGREISMWTFNSKITEIDLTELSLGIYFLKTGQNLNNTIRIIKVL